MDKDEILATQPVTASATIKGFGGDVTVTLTVLEDRITDCLIRGDDETPDTGGRAIRTMQTRLIEAGIAKVDGVSGATSTSRAVLRAPPKPIMKRPASKREN
jgi:uncharacterized protein with FMN-binding domain